MRKNHSPSVSAGAAGYRKQNQAVFKTTPISWYGFWYGDHEDYHHADALQQTGGPLTKKERAWADALLSPQQQKRGGKKGKAA
jgi:hypothetical protein